MDDYFVLVIPVLVIIALIIVYLIYRSINPPLPDYGNNVLNLIQRFTNWTNGSVPYVFAVSPNGTISISWYDGAGYLKGFNTIVMVYQVVDVNNLSLTVSQIINNYSKSPITSPWNIRYISANSIVLSGPGFNYNLSVL